MGPIIRPYQHLISDTNIFRNNNGSTSRLESLGFFFRFPDRQSLVEAGGLMVICKIQITQNHFKVAIKTRKTSIWTEFSSKIFKDFKQNKSFRIKLLFVVLSCSEEYELKICRKNKSGHAFHIRWVYPVSSFTRISAVMDTVFRQQCCTY